MSSHVHESHLIERGYDDEVFLNLHKHVTNQQQVVGGRERGQEPKVRVCLFKAWEVQKKGKYCNYLFWSILRSIKNPEILFPTISLNQELVYHNLEHFNDMIVQKNIQFMCSWIYYESSLLGMVMRLKFYKVEDRPLNVKVALYEAQTSMGTNISTDM